MLSRLLLSACLSVSLIAAGCSAPSPRDDDSETDAGVEQDGGSGPAACANLADAVIAADARACHGRGVDDIRNVCAAAWPVCSAADHSLIVDAAICFKDVPTCTSANEDQYDIKFAQCDMKLADGLSSACLEAWKAANQAP